MIAVDQTIAGAASGETANFRGAEGFTISGKRTEEYRIELLFPRGSNHFDLLFCQTVRLEKFQSHFLFF